MKNLQEPKSSAVEKNELYEKSKIQLISRERGFCSLTKAGQKTTPLEVVYFPIARSMAEIMDWPSFSKACQAGRWGENARQFDWVSFFIGAVDGKPVDPYRFVDDMLVNGILLTADLAAKLQTMPFLQLMAVVYQSKISAPE